MHLPRAALAAMLLLLFTGGSRADERLLRTVDWRTGAPLSSVYDVDQDLEGYLWVTSPQGLMRYDGTEMTLVDADTRSLVHGCAGTGHVRALRGSAGDADVVEVDAGRVVAIPFPPVPEGRHARFEASCSDDGALWIALQGTLWRRGNGEGWTRIEARGEIPRIDRLMPGGQGSVLAGGRDSIVRISADGTLEVLARLPSPFTWRLRPDGTLAVLQWVPGGGRLSLVGGGRVEEVASFPGRPLDLAERGDTLWVSHDGGLLGIRPDGTTSRIEPTPELPIGGALLVDREGSLWVGNSRGLTQLSEPDTVGVGSSQWGRWVRRFHGFVLLSTWHGAMRVQEEHGRFSLLPAVGTSGAVCEDASGRTWVGGGDAFGRTDITGPKVILPFDRVGTLSPCALDGTGRLWMPTLGGLDRLDRGADLPAVEPLPPGASADRTAGAVLVDRGQRLWVGLNGRVCAADARVASLSWRCEALPKAGVVSALVETEDGHVWAASEGVYEHGDDGAWRPLALDASEGLPPTVTELAPSPRRGVWLIGSGAILRVARAAAPGKMAVLERIGAWQGMPTYTTHDAWEDPDGTVWLAGDTALIRVPASARTAPGVPARVEITSLEVDGKALAPHTGFRSPYGRNRLQVRVSAFSYRDPSLVRYRFRMSDRDPWSEPTSNPRFPFYNIAPGRYAIRFAASLDGAHWTETAAPLRFRIDRPWYLQAWFFALAAIAAAAVAWIVHRARVAHLLALARQRSRIAMDLHDAIGSGLGSIGLIAGVGSQDEIEPERRKELSGQIASMASELGMSLSEIVWSLRPGSERLEAVAQYLKVRANRLFLDERARLVIEFPERWPEAPVSLPLRRNLLLIAVEALQNAATHAEASEVRLGIAPSNGAWSLWIEDDGLGVDRGVRPGSGMGLENMKRRAEEIGATLRWTPGARGGTKVTVLFDPRFES